MQVCLLVLTRHLTTRKARTGKKGQNYNQALTYYFDVEKCKVCPIKEGCYKEGAKSKTYLRIFKVNYT